jgi:hypothetical protein
MSVAKLSIPTPGIGRLSLYLAKVYHFSNLFSIRTSDDSVITSDTNVILSDTRIIISDEFLYTNDEMRGFSMPFSPETLEEKPYNICISCSRIGQTCDGPNFLSMTVDRWCEWCRLRRDHLNWKNATIAEKSGISKISIDRIMTGDVKDLRITTMQSVTKALVNGAWGQSPCVLVTETEKEVYVDNPVIIAQCQHLQNTLDTLSEEYKTELAAIREEDRKKIEFLRDQIAIKDKQIEWMQSFISTKK